MILQNNLIFDLLLIFRTFNLVNLIDLLLLNLISLIIYGHYLNKIYYIVLIISVLMKAFN